MSLHRRGKTWWVRFTAPNGQRVRRSTGTEDRKEAEEFHDQLKAKYWRVTRLGEKQERTWNEAAIRWIRETTHKVTHNQDKAKLRWLDRFLRDKPLTAIDRDLIDEIGAAKADESSPSNANRTLALVRSILRRAVLEWEWLDKAPRIRLFPVNPQRVRWLNWETAEKLISCLPIHLAVMARFSLATGLRQSNVSFLEWSQVDMNRKVAWIHPDQAKARKSIPVPLNGEAMRVLEGQKGQDARYVFVYQGKPVKRTTTKAWYRACERAGIEEGFRWHDLRHTWASWHSQAGTPLNVLQELGGWASSEMVKRYAHLGVQHLAEYAARIDPGVSG